MANTKVTGDLIASSTIATGNIADNAVTSDKISGITTAHITEGSNLYYTDARADARITAATTSDLTEGTNLYYTDARADARAALLVDSAPSTLDTLNELAAALGDDPNFATTTANSIGLKAPLASPSFTGNAAFAGTITNVGSITTKASGASNSIVAQWQATNANNCATFRTTDSGYIFRIHAQNSGTIYVQNDDGSNYLKIPDSGSNEISGNATFAGMITVNGGGIDIDNNDDVRLRFDNASAFMAGLQVATTAGDMISSTAINDFAIRSQSNMLFATGGNAERMRITSGGDVGIGTADGPDDVNSKLHVYKNAGDNTVVELLRLDCGENNHNVGKGGSIIWRDINVYTNTASITAQRIGNSGGSTLQFGLRGSEKMRITSGGDIQVQGGDIFLNSGTNYNDKGVVYLSNERTAIISDIVNATANGDTSLDFQTRKSGTRASAMFIDEFRNVGIGTTSPSANLEVAGDVLINSGEYISWGGVGETSIEGSTASNKIQFRTGSGDRMIINNTGVGIGTTSPDATLEIGTPSGVAGSAGSINRLFIAPFSNTGGPYKFIARTVSGASDFLDMYYGSNHIISYGLDGKVGIGTTLPGTLLNIEGSSPILTIEDSRTSIGDGTIMGRIDFKQNDDSGSGTGVSGSIYSISESTTGQGSSLAFKTGVPGSTTEKMRITSGGILQVGTTSTKIKIEPNGDAYTTQTRGWQLSGAVGNTSYPSYGFRDSGGEGMMSSSATNLSLVCGGSVKLHMDSRTNTSYTPDGLWNAAAQPTILKSSSGGGFYLGYQDNGSGLYAQAYGFLTKSTDGLGNTSSRDCIQVKDANTGTINFSITNLGAVTARGSITANGSPSDIRLKENIKPIDNALSKIKKIQGVSFDWKPSDSIVDIKEDYGFIAQEVQKSLPEIIKEDQVGMLSMRYNSVIPILVEGMKELEKIVSDLKKEIIELKSK